MNGPPKTTVHYYPPVSKTNRYVDCNIRIWKKMGICVEPVPFYFRGMVKMLSWRRKQQVVLNWFEDRLNYAERPYWEFARCVAMLLVLRCCFKRIHWVKHNFVGHDSGKSRLRDALEFALKCVSTTRITHRPLPGYTYIPHPLYPVSCDLPKARDIRFLFFGLIKPYKGLEGLLTHWPQAVPLYMVGRCDDTALQKRLQQIIEASALSVIWRQSFIPDDELNGLLARTQCVVIPHSESAMIVSGAAYHAISYGAQLLVKQGDFGSYLQARLGDAVQIFDHENVSHKVESFKYRAAFYGRGQSIEDFGDQSVGESWRPVLQAVNINLKKGRLIREKLNGFER